MCSSHDLVFNQIGNLGTTQEIHDACLAANGGTLNCAVRTCIIESEFVKFAAGYANTQVPNYAEYSVVTGNFNFEQGCPIIPGEQSDRQCCGAWSNGSRFPYRTLGGARACCGEITYYTADAECCAGNSLELAC